MAGMSTAEDLAALVTEYRDWHIWRGRSASGADAEWHATCKHRRDGRRARLTATDAAGLREQLAVQEALEGAAA